MDLLLKEMFESSERWEHAIDIAVQKGISKAELRELCDPQIREQLFFRIASGNYKIFPPHTQQIPKDNGDFRTVYINESIDRIFLSMANDLLFELCRDMIHKSCKSYQKGIGCGKVVIGLSRKMQKMFREKHEVIGWKIDLSKYFDSVAIRFIDEIFDEVEKRVGKSAVIDILRDYYHTDYCFDLKQNPIQHYQSLKQGCAVASFLADALLYEMDEVLSNMKGTYVRYSDDCLYIGEDWQKAKEVMEQMLAEKQLTLNPKKVEYVKEDRYVTFLGFALRGGQITLSKNRVKSFQKEITKRTIKNKNATYKSALHSVLWYLYGGEYSWARSILPIVNVNEDLYELNKYVMDALRAVQTKKKEIGGLGYVPEGKVGVVDRPPGQNVTANRKKTNKKLEGYYTIVKMRNAYMSNHEAYEALVRMMV